MGFDLEWETPDRVYGELLLERRQLAFDGTGSFTTPPGLTRRTGSARSVGQRSGRRAAGSAPSVR